MSPINLKKRERVITIYPNFLKLTLWFFVITLIVILAITRIYLILLLIPLIVYGLVDLLLVIKLSKSEIVLDYLVKGKVLLPVEGIQNFYRGYEYSKYGKREYITIRLIDNTYYNFYKHDVWNYPDMLKYLKSNVTQSIEPWPPKGSKYLF